MSAALMIIDPQEGWRHWSVNDVLDRIPDFAKKFDGEIIVMRFINPPSSPFNRFLDWSNFADEEEHKIIESYKSLRAHEFMHQTYGCLTPEVEEFLTSKNIDTVYLSGIFTDVCVAMTAMQLFDSNREPFVISDLVGTLHGNKVHDAALKSLGSIIGQRHTITSDTLI